MKTLATLLLALSLGVSNSAVGEEKKGALSLFDTAPQHPKREAVYGHYTYTSDDADSVHRFVTEDLSLRVNEDLSNTDARSSKFVVAMGVNPHQLHNLDDFSYELLTFARDQSSAFLHLLSLGIDHAFPFGGIGLEHHLPGYAHDSDAQKNWQRISRAHLSLGESTREHVHDHITDLHKRHGMIPSEQTRSHFRAGDAALNTLIKQGITSKNDYWRANEFFMTTNWYAHSLQQKGIPVFSLDSAQTAHVSQLMQAYHRNTAAYKQLLGAQYRAQRHSSDSSSNQESLQAELSHTILAQRQRLLTDLRNQNLLGARKLRSAYGTTRNDVAVNSAILYDQRATQWMDAFPTNYVSIAAITDRKQAEALYRQAKSQGVLLLTVNVAGK